MLPAQPIQGLIDGLACLEAVLGAGEPVGSREVGRRCGLNRTRANRLLGTWRHLGLLGQAEDARYQPGPGLHVLAGLGLHASGLLRAGLEPAARWWGEGYAVTLAVRWQDRIGFLLHARPELPLLSGIGHRATAPAVGSSAGLAMLAALDANELATWDLAAQWDAKGDGGELAARLERVRTRGYASRSYRDGTRSVGVAFDPAGQTALAVSRHDLTPRELAPIARRLRADADAITARLRAGDAPPIDEAPIRA